MLTGRRFEVLPAVTLRHVPKVLPDPRRVGAPHSEHAHRVRAPPLEQIGAGAFREGDQATTVALAEGVHALRQEISVTRVDAHTQEDAHRGEAVHVRVLLQGVQREEQPAAAPAHPARQDHQLDGDRVKGRRVRGGRPGEF